MYVVWVEKVGRFDCRSVRIFGRKFNIKKSDYNYVSLALLTDKEYFYSLKLFQKNVSLCTFIKILSVICTYILWNFKNYKIVIFKITKMIFLKSFVCFFKHSKTEDIFFTNVTVWNFQNWHLHLFKDIISSVTFLDFKNDRWINSTNKIKKLYDL